MIQARSSQGIAGEWQVVEAGPSDTETDTTSLKREAETPIDETDPRQFKLRKRTLATGLGQIYDPGTIAIKIKKKEEEEVDPLAVFQPKLPPPTSPAAVQDGPQATEKPKWVKVQWRKPGEQNEEAQDEPHDAEPESKSEPEPQLKTEPTVDLSLEPHVKPEPAADDLPPPVTTAAPIFKKRKVPATSAKGKREV